MIPFMKEKHWQSRWNRIDPGVSLCSISQAMTSPSLLTLGGLTLALVSCGSFKNLNQPLSGSGDFDPLSSPGSSSSGGSAVVAPTSPSYKPGQWVETSMPNATFFRVIPKGNARADKVLAVATPLKVVSSKGTYVKVELDSGDIGYVPEIMVIERGSPGEVPVTGPAAPLTDYGPVPPPLDTGVGPGGEIAPPPVVPGTPPPVPEVPSIPDTTPAPAPEIPGIPGTTPEPSIPDTVPTVPTVPDVAPPPEVPGVTEPEKID